ncbi:glycosyltransferase [Neokomagataea thailandica NBRC 106555]|uniref:Glycosyltransferase family 2 protein n=2 Tax=Neokomagataea TaxID=1223423 RepID=A0A4Y6V5A1_9PROT|nr:MULTISPECIES: glycosyltransferase family 2 protein [Neokomagataea]QDH25229.1 glycosyltransferase family 2 protein [Neokomagataea tanensis]GBR54702.1 glycosyltransferase [Neokomagataea thailandica NBRC 106555]
MTNAKSFQRTETPSVTHQKHAASSVAILLSIYNGSAFLAEQLSSYLHQTHTNWHLYWRDDGSSDNSLEIIRYFAQTDGLGRCSEITTEEPRLGVQRSFFSLMANAATHDYYAFSDQDDVWLPDKLERAVAALGATHSEQNALYFSGYYMTDQSLKITGKSSFIQKEINFQNTLTQNVASGMSMVFNKKLRNTSLNFINTSTLIYHDWWMMLLTTSFNSTIRYDPVPALLYRQHQSNSVGAQSSFIQRSFKALTRGPFAFLNMFEANAANLYSHAQQLPSENRFFLEELINAKSFFERFIFLTRHPKFRRQGRLENITFKLWFLLGSFRKEQYKKDLL